MATVMIVVGGLRACGVRSAMVNASTMVQRLFFACLNLLFLGITCNKMRVKVSRGVGMGNMGNSPRQLR